jgi:hypothetical protein
METEAYPQIYKKTASSFYMSAMDVTTILGWSIVLKEVHNNMGFDWWPPRISSAAFPNSRPTNYDCSRLMMEIYDHPEHLNHCKYLIYV